MKVSDACEGKIIKFSFECIIRQIEGDKVELLFVGLPNDPRKEAVGRLNAGQHLPADIDALESLPVFDMADVEDAPLTIIGGKL